MISKAGTHKTQLHIHSHNTFTCILWETNKTSFSLFYYLFISSSFFSFILCTSKIFYYESLLAFLFRSLINFVLKTDWLYFTFQKDSNRKKEEIELEIGSKVERKRKRSYLQLMRIKWISDSQLKVPLETLVQTNFPESTVIKLTLNNWTKSGVSLDGRWRDVERSERLDPKWQKSRIG